jgi:hypothetical protein
LAFRDKLPEGITFYPGMAKPDDLLFDINYKVLENIVEELKHPTISNDKKPKLTKQKTTFENQNMTKIKEKKKETPPRPRSVSSAIEISNSGEEHSIVNELDANFSNPINLKPFKSERYLRHLF